MKPQSSHAHPTTARDVRGAAHVAEGRELYQSYSQGSQGGASTTNALRMRERIERARNANLNS